MYPLHIFDYLENGGPVRKEDVAAYCYMHARFAMDIAAGCETRQAQLEALDDARVWQMHGARYWKGAHPD